MQVLEAGWGWAGRHSFPRGVMGPQAAPAASPGSPRQPAGRRHRGLGGGSRSRRLHLKRRGQGAGATKCGKRGFRHFLVGTKEPKNHLPLTAEASTIRGFISSNIQTHQHTLTEELGSPEHALLPTRGPTGRGHSSSFSSRAGSCDSASHPASLDAPHNQAGSSRHREVRLLACALGGRRGKPPLELRGAPRLRALSAIGGRS